METPQRLKRGLKDISSLFQGPAPAAGIPLLSAEGRIRLWRKRGGREVLRQAQPFDSAQGGEPVEPDGERSRTTAGVCNTPLDPLSQRGISLPIRCLSVYSAHLPSDSLLLSTFLASKLANGKTPCFILTLNISRRGAASPRGVESFGQHVKRLTVTEGEWRAIEECLSSSLEGEPLFLTAEEAPGLPGVSGAVPILARSARAGGGDAKWSRPLTESYELIFLDWDYSKLSRFGKLLSVLDQCILLVQPTLESLSECYRLIKSARYFHPDLEYFFLYEGPPSDRRAEGMFEGFSRVISERFGTDLIWLGYVEWPRQGQPLHYHLNFRMLLEGRFRRQEYSGQRRALHHFIHHRFQGGGPLPFLASSSSELFSPDILTDTKSFYHEWRLNRSEMESLVELGSSLNFPA